MKSFLSFVVLGLVTLCVSATDRFYINDFNITPGETCTVSIMLDNETAFTAFQTDINLPEGMDVDLQSFALTNRKATDHRISARTQPDGTIRLISYSLGVNPYSDNSGALVTFQVTACDDMTLPATIDLKQSLFTCLTGEETALPDNVCNVYLQNDVDCNGIVGLDDLTTLINILVYLYEYQACADVNKDGYVGMDDLTLLINVLVGK